MADKKVLGPYRTQVDGKRFVEEKQYRVGPSGLVRVEHALGKIRELPIFFGAGEEPVLYTVTVVLRRVSAGDVKAQTSCTNMKVGDLVSPNSSETWQSHTAASIVELWPTVLAENWLEAPGTTAAILGHRARLNAIEEHLAMPRGGGRELRRVQGARTSVAERDRPLVGSIGRRRMVLHGKEVAVTTTAVGDEPRARRS